MSENKNCCGERRKIREGSEKQALMNRLSRIEGQIRGIRGMVEKDAYCPEVLVQVSAASAALNSFARAMMDAHIRSCVMEDVRGGNADAVDELIEVLHKFVR